MKNAIVPLLKIRVALLVLPALAYSLVLVSLFPRAMQPNLDFPENLALLSALADFFSEPDHLIGLLAFFAVNYKLTKTIDKHIRIKILTYSIKHWQESKQLFAKH